MKVFKIFHYYFLGAIWKIRAIVVWLLSLLFVDAVAIAFFEKMPFADALYLAFVTGLTIGYGDITPKTFMGRVVAILIGLQGLIITGIIVAIAVYSMRKTIEWMDGEE